MIWVSFLFIKELSTRIIDYHPSPNSLLKVFFFYYGFSGATGGLGGSGGLTGLTVLLVGLGLVVVWLGCLFVPKKLAKSFLGALFTGGCGF